jgi:hypothetical protein
MKASYLVGGVPPHLRSQKEAPLYRVVTALIGLFVIVVGVVVVLFGVALVACGAQKRL